MDCRLLSREEVQRLLHVGSSALDSACIATIADVLEELEQIKKRRGCRDALSIVCVGSCFRASIDAGRPWVLQLDEDALLDGMYKTTPYRHSGACELADLGSHPPMDDVRAIILKAFYRLYG